MKTIRTNCFETNSSSTHSFTIDKSYSQKKDFSVKDVEIEYTDFGWCWAKYNDFVTKCSYFWTLSQDQELDLLKRQMIRLSKKHHFILKTNGSGYVDHGDEHYEKMLKLNPELRTDDGLWEFISHPKHWLITGNDNHNAPANAYLTPNQIANAYGSIEFIDFSNSVYIVQKNDPNEIKRVAYLALEDYLCDECRKDLSYFEIISHDKNVIGVQIKKYDYHKKSFDYIKNLSFKYKVIPRN